MIALCFPCFQGGNRGAWCLSRTEADVTHFEMLTFWDVTAAIQRFAGEDYARARYYGFDPDFLIEMEPHVQPYNLDTATTPDHP